MSARSQKEGRTLALKLTLICCLIVLILLASPLTASAASRVQTSIQLTSPNSPPSIDFGSSVAVGDGLVVIGAPSETAAGQLYAGNVYVFNASTGGLVFTLVSPNPRPYAGFGWAVSVGEGLIVVGAPFLTSAYVFNASTGALMYNTLTSLKPQEVSGQFGSSVSVGGGLVVVSAPGETTPRQDFFGNVYVFNASTGARMFVLANPSQVLEDFGVSVGVGGGRVVVSSSTSVYVYNPLTASLEFTLTNPNPQPPGRFGLSVGVVEGLIVVGAPGETSFSGNVYVFGANTGRLEFTLTSPNPQAGYFGLSVSVGGGRVVVGQAGNAYIFR